MGAGGRAGERVSGGRGWAGESRWAGKVGGIISPLSSFKGKMVNKNISLISKIPVGLDVETLLR